MCDSTCNSISQATSNSTSNLTREVCRLTLTGFRPGVVRESDAGAGDDLPEALAVTWGTNEGMALPWPGVLLVTLPGMAKTWRSCAPGAPLTMNRRGD
jgi:hypothetical protein